MSGILEELITDIQNKVYEADGEVKPESIVEYIQALQEHEYDAHVVIMGQNGNGKSMLLLELMKRLEPDSIMNDNLLFAFNNTGNFIKMLKEKKKSVIGIDELKKFFHYREHSTTEQIVLTNMIEYARSNRLAVIGCCNDIRRINSNYRNAKVQMVIWLLDRYDDDDIGKSYGLVFIGNPALEEEDKFRLNAFQNVYTFEQIRLIAESLPTFLGYMFVDDIRKIVSKEEIDTYLKKKNDGIKKEAERFMKKLDDKEKGLVVLSPDDIYLQAGNIIKDVSNRYPNDAYGRLEAYKSYMKDISINKNVKGYIMDEVKAIKEELKKSTAKKKVR
jgi:ABC-type dipeptide/oligopeptide/nickel transport system ATPase component